MVTARIDDFFFTTDDGEKQKKREMSLCRPHRMYFSCFSCIASPPSPISIMSTKPRINTVYIVPVSMYLDTVRLHLPPWSPDSPDRPCDKQSMVMYGWQLCRIGAILVICANPDAHSNHDAFYIFAQVLAQHFQMSSCLSLFKPHLLEDPREFQCVEFMSMGLHTYFNKRRANATNAVAATAAHQAHWIDGITRDTCGKST